MSGGLGCCLIVFVWLLVGLGGSYPYLWNLSEELDMVGSYSS